MTLMNKGLPWPRQPENISTALRPFVTLHCLFYPSIMLPPSWQHVLLYVPFACIAFTKFIVFSKKTIPVVTWDFLSWFDVPQHLHTGRISSCGNKLNNKNLFSYRASLTNSTIFQSRSEILPCSLVDNLKKWKTWLVRWAVVDIFKN